MISSAIHLLPGLVYLVRVVQCLIEVLSVIFFLFIFFYSVIYPRPKIFRKLKEAKVHQKGETSWNILIWWLTWSKLCDVLWNHNTWLFFVISDIQQVASSEICMGYGCRTWLSVLSQWLMWHLTISPSAEFVNHNLSCGYYFMCCVAKFPSAVSGSKLAFSFKNCPPIHAKSNIVVNLWKSWISVCEPFFVW